MLSSAFWLRLSLALLFFVLALAFINRSKFEFIRRLMAGRLRQKAVPKLKEILPMIGAVFRAEQADFFPMFRLKADLEVLSAKSEVLYEVEQEALADFLAKLSEANAKFDAGFISKERIDELVLSCQRAINELTELA